MCVGLAYVINSKKQDLLKPPTPEKMGSHFRAASEKKAIREAPIAKQEEEEPLKFFVPCTPASFPAAFRQIPFYGAQFKSGVGYRRNPFLKAVGLPWSKVYKLHTGDDWAGPMGTPIHAPAAGVIEVAGRRGDYGNYIRIRHNSDIKTAYGHLMLFEDGVEKGVTVKKGQIIGYLGNTGFSTGPHVHYELIYKGVFVESYKEKTCPADFDFEEAIAAAKDSYSRPKIWRARVQGLFR